MRHQRLFALCLILSATHLVAQWLEKTIELPTTPGPKTVAYAAATGRWFVGGDGSYVMVIDPMLGVVARIHTGGEQRAVCPNETGSRIYAACAASDIVAVIDAATQSVIANIAVGDEPGTLAYNSAQQKLYCYRRYPDSLSVIDCVTNTFLRSVFAGRAPAALCYGEVGGRVYAACRDDDRVAVIDGVPDTVVKLLDVGYLPSALCYSRTSNKVYCANYGDSTVSVLDCSADSVLAILHIGVRPSYLVWSQQGNKVYCASWTEDAVIVIDCAADSVVARLAVGDAPSALVCAPAEGRVYCADYSSEDVRVIDCVRDTVVATIPVGYGPTAMAVSASHRLCVADRASSDVRVIDCLTNLPLDIFTTWSGPTAVCYDSVADRLFCADEAGWVHVLDCATDSFGADLHAGAGTCAICCNPAGRRVFSANKDAGTVTVIDATLLRVIKNTACGAGPTALCYNPNSDRVYCANFSGNTVTVLDGTTGNLVTTVPVGSGPIALCHNPVNNKVYCVNLVGYSVTVIDGATNGIIATVPVGRYPFGVCYSPIENRVYCTNSNDNTVSIVDGVTNQVVATVRVGGGPVALCHNPAHDYVYCGNYGTGGMTVIDCTTHAAIDTILTNGCPTVVRYFPTSDHVYAANPDEYSVSIVHCGVNKAFWEVEDLSEPVDLAMVVPHSRVYVPCGSDACIAVIHDVSVDVGAVAVVQPDHAMELGDTVRPAGQWRNYGNDSASFQARMRLFDRFGQSRYVQTVNAVLPPGGDTVIGTFPPCTLRVAGDWWARCSTSMPGDMEPEDDAVTQWFYVYPPDIGMQAILAPTGRYDTGGLAVPRVTCRNWHGLSVGFTAWCRVRDPDSVQVYSESLTVTALALGCDTTIAFPGFHIGKKQGTWTCRCSAACAGDGDHWNDTLSRQFAVQAGGVAPTPGWFELKPMPLSSSGKPVKDGGWLVYMDEDGYVYGAKGCKTGDFFCYDPLGDTWHQLPSIPAGDGGKQPGKGAAATTDGERFLYATRGNNTLEFWRYDIERSVWRRLADVPLGPSNKKVKGGTDLAYVDCEDSLAIYLLKGYKNDFCRYNVESNAWVVLDSAPVGASVKWDKGSWLVYDEDYSLYAHKAKFHEFWRYDIEETCWSRDSLHAMPKTGRSGRSKKVKDGGCAVWLDEAIYALKGGNTQEFWKYDVEYNAWTELDTIPAVGSTHKKRRVKSGADITCDGMDCFYVLKGNRCREFWRYILPWSMAVGVPEREGVADAESPKPQASSPKLRATIVRGVLNLQSATCNLQSEVVLLDASGRRVMSLRPGTNDVSHLAPGVYFVHSTLDTRHSSITKVVLTE